MIIRVPWPGKSQTTRWPCFSTQPSPMRLCACSAGTCPHHRSCPSGSVIHSRWPASDGTASALQKLRGGALILIQAGRGIDQIRRFLLIAPAEPNTTAPAEPKSTVSITNPPTPKHGPISTRLAVTSKPPQTTANSPEVAVRCFQKTGPGTFRSGKKAVGRGSPLRCQWTWDRKEYKEQGHGFWHGQKV